MAALAKQLFDILLDLHGLLRIGRRNENHTDVQASRHAPLKGPQRNNDHIVLVLAKSGFALGFQNANHLARDISGAQRCANRVLITKQFAAHRFADHANRPARSFLGPVKGAPVHQGPFPNRHIAVIGAVNAGGPAFISINHFDGFRGRGGDPYHAIYFFQNGVRICDFKRPSFVSATGSMPPRRDDQEVFGPN